MANNNVIGYIRVSTENQVGEDKFGLDVQRREITQYCEANGLNLIDIIEDAAFSGADTERPGIHEILSRSAEGEFTAVVVAKLDRLSRDLFFQMFIDKELRKSDVRVISVAEPFNSDDPMTQLMRQMVGAFAEYERHMIKSRMTGGRKQKASQGGYAGGGVPLGYVTVRGTGKIAVDEDKVATVREIFALRAAGLSMPKICDELNANGHTTREGKRFSAMTVKRVLDNEEFYRGNYVYDKKSADGAKVVEGAKHEAIL